MQKTFSINGCNFEWIEPLAAIPVDDYPLIEDVVGDEMAQVIYDRWNVSEFGSMLDFGGDVKGISVAMIVELGMESVKSSFGLSEANAELFFAECKAVYEPLPFH